MNSTQQCSSPGQAYRNRWPRAIGLGIGFLGVATVFYQRGAEPWMWVLLVFHGFVWPQVAFARAVRNRDPRRAEEHNLLVDAFLGGGWAVLMHFNLVPSVVILTMMAMNNIAVGGPRLFGQGAAAMVAGALLAGFVAGFGLEPRSSLIEMLASVPMLVAYPVLIGFTTHRLAMRLADERSRFQTLSRTDALSGLNNRGQWDLMVAAEFARLRRNGGECALLLIDIDHFKAFNDRHGHARGDAAIVQVARILQEERRTEDVVARYGGEEFTVLMPGADLAGGRKMAERLRRRFDQAAMEGDRLTVSVGVAAFDAGMKSARDWVARADTALYQAKRQGRDRTVAYSPEMGVRPMPEPQPT